MKLYKSHKVFRTILDTESCSVNSRKYDYDYNYDYYQVYINKTELIKKFPNVLFFLM